MGGSGEDTVAALFAAGSAPLREALRVEAADTVIPSGSPAGPALRRARSLLLFGLTTAAQREIDEAVRSAGKSRETLRQVARWSLARGIPESAFRLGWALEASSPDPGTARLAYPAAFADYVLVESQETGVPASLLWAIMRQESSFDPLARSPAGAVGLLQLMPATARATAQNAGLPYSVQRLTSDPLYNATLGAEHLCELLDRLNHSYVLTFVAYNAGPGRSRDWVLAYGDPRGGAADPIDWIERIPFDETRNYVKKVTLSHHEYRRIYGSGGR
jgi:soluble lytic murein transglycosylase